MTPSERAKHWALDRIIGLPDFPAVRPGRWDPLHHEIALALDAFAAEAVRARDFEWWEAIALVDNVAPTPEACKKFVADCADLWVKEAVRVEREALREAVESAMRQAYDNPAEYRRLIRAVFRARTPASGKEGKITTPVPCPDCGSEKEYCPCTTPKAPRP